MEEDSYELLEEYHNGGFYIYKGVEHICGGNVLVYRVGYERNPDIYFERMDNGNFMRYTFSIPVQEYSGSDSADVVDDYYSLDSVEDTFYSLDVDGAAERSDLPLSVVGSIDFSDRYGTVAALEYLLDSIWNQLEETDEC